MFVLQFSFVKCIDMKEKVRKINKYYCVNEIVTFCL